MKLTRRAHYSVKAMLDLVVSSKSGAASVKEIAQRQSIPAHFLEKILIDLRRANLVESKRGASGGYRLKQSPKQISLGEILAAVGGDGKPLASLGQDLAQSHDCVTFAVWNRLDQTLQAALYAITLEDLYYDAQSWQASQGAVFMV
jgi:Rrf2 family transcriptional regulator, iron-sulfur cluster assembly transcription factor